jgi:hypothetical protein
MSHSANDIMIEDAIALAVELDEIFDGGYYQTAMMYVRDYDMDRLQDYFDQMKTELRAYQEVAADGRY